MAHARRAKHFEMEEDRKYFYGIRSSYKMVAALLAGTGIRISELLSLEIGKHISADCAVITIRQQRGKWGGIESTPKSEAGFGTLTFALSSPRCCGATSATASQASCSRPKPARC
jgi:hypothetical protein